MGAKDSIQNSRENITIADNNSEMEDHNKLPKIDGRRPSQNYYINLKEKQLRRHQQNQ